MRSETLSLLIRVVAGFNIVLLLPSFWYSGGLLQMRFLRWAHLMDADLYWTIGSTAVLPLLLIAEVFMSRRERRVDSRELGRSRRQTNLLIDAALVFGWTLFLALVAAHGMAGFLAG